MSARVLIVDDLFVNAKLLGARLSAEYFEVATALSAAEAIAMCDYGLCDIVLTDVMMPGMDGFELCRTLKTRPATAHIPVVMVTALDQPSDRVKGLDAGADDFLVKPVDEVALVARVRSLVRLKAIIDELRARAETSRALGVDPLAAAAAETGLGGRILVIEDRPSASERILATLGPIHDLVIEKDPQEALYKAAAGAVDLVILGLDVGGGDGLRLVSQLRTMDQTRHAGVLLLAEPHETGRILRGLDIGANDYLLRPIDRNELLARVRTQVKRKRYADRLRESLRASVDLAVVDPLTQLYNRRFLDTHCATLVEEAHASGRALSVLMLDVDRFKTVNDSYGHEAGDDVLREFAGRLKAQIRQEDLAARFGGEELVVLMPDTSADTALGIAERIRHAVETSRFQVEGGARSIPLTISVGVAELEPGDTPQSLMRRADEALYGAKGAGRNRVVMRARAA
jgi:two-component system cell cycle response regulator